jgi:hypothetical protein
MDGVFEEVRERLQVAGREADYCCDVLDLVGESVHIEVRADSPGRGNRYDAGNDVDGVARRGDGRWQVGGSLGAEDSPELVRRGGGIEAVRSASRHQIETEHHITRAPAKPLSTP